MKADICTQEEKQTPCITTLPFQDLVVQHLNHVFLHIKEKDQQTLQFMHQQTAELETCLLNLSHQIKPPMNNTSTSSSSTISQEHPLPIPLAIPLRTTTPTQESLVHHSSLPSNPQMEREFIHSWIKYGPQAIEVANQLVSLPFMPHRINHNNHINKRKYKVKTTAPIAARTTPYQEDEIIQALVIMKQPSFLSISPSNKKRKAMTNSAWSTRNLAPTVTLPILKFKIGGEEFHVPVSCPALSV